MTTGNNKLADDDNDDKYFKQYAKDYNKSLKIGQLISQLADLLNVAAPHLDDLINNNIHKLISQKLELSKKFERQKSLLSSDIFE